MIILESMNYFEDEIIKPFLAEEEEESEKEEEKLEEGEELEEEEF